MDNEPVKIGRINSKTEKALEINLEGNIFCYILEAKLREFINRWPRDYLKKIEEASNIIKEPLYAGIDSKNKLIYLIKDYLVENKRFKKACLVLDYKNQLQIIDIIPFDNERLSKLSTAAKFTKVRYAR